MKRRRVAKGIWILLLILALFFLGGDSFGTGDAIAQIARAHLYGTARWEVSNFPKKWSREFTGLFTRGDSCETQIARVRRYFDLARQANGLRFRIDQARNGFAAEPDLAALGRELAALQRQRERIEPAVEETLEAMIAAVLKDAGISSKLLFVRHLWPPVDFRLDTVPGVLIVSPRDRIHLQSARLIDPAIAAADRDALERAIDGRNLSSLVSGLAGVATYPSLVPETDSLREALETAAHEWTHHYLFFHPLGRALHRNAGMTTMNETVADIVGREIGREVYRRHFATPQEREAPPAPAGEAPAFDFNAFMRQTRLEAERLLAAGRIDEAEGSMEARRKELGQHGYFLRKINQAYFAFHGTYAERPGAVSPIGGQLRRARDESQSLGRFLSRVARYSSYASFLRDLGEGG